MIGIFYQQPTNNQRKKDSQKNTRKKDSQKKTRKNSQKTHNHSLNHGLSSWNH